MTRLSDHNWYNQLPWVLLGLRSTPKADLDASVAEIVYGEPIAVLGDLFPPTVDALNDRQFLRALHQDIATLRPAPNSRHGTQSPYVPAALRKADFVFVRRDGHASPLQSPDKSIIFFTVYYNF